MSLILHCGASKATREELEISPTPQATETWTPIGHYEFLTQVESALASRKMRIVSEAHGLTRYGARYFGLLEIESEELENKKDHSLVVGTRNSHDRKFPASLAIGANAFICDNLSFSSEIVTCRRHTTHIRRDLPGLVSRAVAQLVDKWGFQEKRFEVYKNFELTTTQAHDLAIRALDARAITSHQLPHVLKEYRYPRHEEFRPRTAWSFFNAVTETSKESNLWNLAPRTQALHGLLDAECNVLLGQN